MDYEALKEQWGEVEDRDGVRLSWNVFPSSRMVLHAFHYRLQMDTDRHPGSKQASGSHRSPLYTSEGKARYTNSAV